MQKFGRIVHIANDRSVKFSTQIGGVIRKIFGYRDIADLTFSDL